MKIILTTLSFSALAIAQSSAVVLWNAGKIDNAQEWSGAGGGTGPGTGAEDVRFVQELGVNAAPGSATNTGGEGVGRDIDDDYYFAGSYPSPIGIVGANEANMERAWTGGDSDLRFHFNFPNTVTATDLVSITFGITSGFDLPDAIGWDIEVSMNGVSLYTQDVVNGDQGGDWTSPTFTLGDVGGVVGPGNDNYVTLHGTNVGSTSRWLSLDYAQVDVTPVPEPSSLGFIAVAATGLALIRRRRGN
ncbi:MAG: hypothetical protein ACI9UA_006031 [Pseudoalteromonas tetraodonis]|jgi:hypothetical protein